MFHVVVSKNGAPMDLEVGQNLPVYGVFEDPKRLIKFLFYLDGNWVWISSKYFQPMANYF